MTRFLEISFPEQKVINVIKHEIRNPLTNIKSFLETLYEYHFELADLQALEFLEIINKETNRLIKLTNTTLQVAHFNSYYFLQFFNLFFLDRLVKQIVDFYGITSLTKNVCLYSKYPFHFLQSVGNYDLLLQILYNLIDNALKYVYSKEIIIIKIKCIHYVSLQNRKHFSLIRVEVLDTGIGLQNRITTTYILKEKMYSKNGMGLGLAIIESALFAHKRSKGMHSMYSKGMNIFFNLN